VSSPGLAENRTKIKRSDLKRIGLLGCGGFGAVELWEHSKTGGGTVSRTQRISKTQRRVLDVLVAG